MLYYCSSQICRRRLELAEVVVYRSDLPEQIFTPEEAPLDSEPEKHRRTSRAEALLEVLFLLALTPSEMEKLTGKVALITGNILICF